MLFLLITTLAAQEKTYQLGEDFRGGGFSETSTGYWSATVYKNDVDSHRFQYFSDGLQDGALNFYSLLRRPVRCF